MSAKRIDTYVNRTGEHCGSVAMGNLLRFYCNLDLPEAVVFGLGSGIDLLYGENERARPAYTIFGRSITMEVDLGLALGLDYREQPQPDNDLAWREVKAQIDAGRPTMLSGDIFYLDYRKYNVHFPAHRFVLLGYDEDAGTALVADRVDEAPQTCSLDALRLSRNPPPGESISTFNLWGRFQTTVPRHTLAEAAALALRKTVARMHGEDTSQVDVLRLMAGGPGVTWTGGLAGLAALARAIPDWRENPDAAFIAKYAANTIERYGNGGGNFRLMYAGFLEWAAALLPGQIDHESIALARQSATAWTRLSDELLVCAEPGAPAAAFATAAETAGRILDLETHLFDRLAIP